jgi:hypothetical protein
MLFPRSLASSLFPELRGPRRKASGPPSSVGFPHPAQSFLPAVVAHGAEWDISRTFMSHLNRAAIIFKFYELTVKSMLLKTR